MNDHKWWWNREFINIKLHFDYGGGCIWEKRWKDLRSSTWFRTEIKKDVEVLTMSYVILEFSGERGEWGKKKGSCGGRGKTDCYLKILLSVNHLI